MSSREAMVALDQQLKAMVKELDIKIEESADIFVYRVCHTDTQTHIPHTTHTHHPHTTHALIHFELH